MDNFKMLKLPTACTQFVNNSINAAVTHKSTMPTGGEDYTAVDRKNEHKGKLLSS